MHRLLGLCRQSSDTEIFRLKVGDISPNFSAVQNLSGTIIDDVLQPGKCYLINFWATWCGNCLLELRLPDMPAVAAKFLDDTDFVFLPVCIDSSLNDLSAFFESTNGRLFAHLREVTMLDIDRSANSLFAESGHLPLTVVVGKDGRIRYIRFGRLSTVNHFEELENAIKSGLQPL